MARLAVAAVLWIAIHIGLAGTELRGAVARRVGEGGFRALFSVLSLASIAFLITSYNATAGIGLWSVAGWARWVLAVAMLLASWLFVASVASPNPTAVGGEKAVLAPVRGVQRMTRHPMLWAFAIWAAVHLVGNGDTASILLFGAFLVTALAGMPSIDAKLARRDPAHWASLAAATSILPGGAILAGRNQLVLGEIGLPVWVGGAVLWAVLLFGHRYVVGVSPVPW